MQKKIQYHIQAHHAAKVSVMRGCKSFFITLNMTFYYRDVNIYFIILSINAFKCR